MASALRDESADTRTFLLPDHGAAAASTTAATAGATAASTQARPAAGRLLVAGAAALLLLAGAVWALVASSQDPDGAPAGIGAATDVEETRTVRVRAADYVGRPVAASPATSRTSTSGCAWPRVRGEPGGPAQGTVADVRPTGLVEVGDLVVLTVVGRASHPVGAA